MPPINRRELDDAIEAVYSAFSKVPRPASIPGCEHCLPPEEADVLLRTNLRDLSADQISSYASDVFLTVGDNSDFIYFWPRILELTILGKFSWPDPEVVIGKLGLARWSDWPETLSAPIQNLMDEQFDAVIEEGEPHKIDEWLCGIGRSVPDIRPYLDKIVEKASPEALIGFIHQNMDVFKKGKPDNAFWDYAPENARHLTHWMRSDPAKSLLKQMYGMQIDDP